MQNKKSKPSVSGDAAVNELLQQGIFLHQTGRLGKSLAALDECLRRTPEDSDAIADKAMVLDEMGRGGE